MTPELSALLAGLVVETVASVVESREPGHCIRIDALPTGLATETCRRLQEVSDRRHVVRLVTASPTAAWQVTPTMAVTLRNESETATPKGILVIFVPPESRLSVEDSIGASTFEVLAFDDLGRRAQRAAQGLAEVGNVAAADIATVVAKELLDDPRYHCNHLLVAEYLLRVAAGTGREAAGIELTQVGLLPDRGLPDLGSRDEMRRRLQLNDQQMTSLETNSVPAERLRNLPIETSSDEGRAVMQSLRGALADGTTDRLEIAGRLAGSAVEVDYSQWNVETNVMFAKRFEIVGLHGDFDQDAAEPTIRRADPSVGVRFVCDPPPASLPEAHSLRLEILAVGRDADDVSETGVVAAKTSLPRATTSSWKRKVAVGDVDAGLEPGLYRFRLSLMAKDNTQTNEAMSELFRVGADISPAASVQESVLAVRDAHVKAIDAGIEPLTATAPKIAMGDDGATVEYVVRYEGSSKVWALSRPRILADFEAQLLSDASLRGFEIEIDGKLGDENWLQFDAALPPAYESARSALFDRLRDVQLARDGTLPSIALADVSSCRREVLAYIEAWTDGLRSSDPATVAALLSTDQVHVSQDGELLALLVAPTHPVRLAWLSRYDQLLEEWTSQAADLPRDARSLEAQELAATIDELLPLNLPPVLINRDTPFRSTDALTREWGLWSAAAGADRMATTARVRSWLSLPAWRLGATGESELVGRVRAYLESHPYVRRLVVNVVQPGEADLALRLVGQLQSQGQGRNPDMSFVLRLFGESDDPSLGLALDSFMSDPEDSRAIRRETAEELTRPSPDPLAPKLSYSKHDVQDLLARPEEFPAHISVFLDCFEVEITPLPQPPAGRSFFAGGLIIEPVQRYTDGDSRRAPSWVNAVSVTDTGPLPDAVRAAQQATARLMGAEGLDPTPALRLEIDSVRQAVLDAVHRSSDWVITIDPVFSDEFLDRPGAKGSSQSYVIDMQAGTDRPGGRNVVVSSKVRTEQALPLVNAGKRFGFEIPVAGSHALMDGMNSLGAGVALRLLLDERRAKEALSLALAAAHLDATGILRHALVVPVDMHQELFLEGRERGLTSSISRTDLAVFQLDPVERRIGLHLVEVKVRSSLGAAGEVPPQLAAEIRDQLANTETVLLGRLFGAQLRDRQFSLPGALQLRRLTVLLRRYLGRAVRHGLIDDAEAGPMDAFVESLQQGFRLGVSMHGLVFHASGRGSRLEEHDGVQMTVLGSDYVRELLEGAERAATCVAGQDRDQYLKTVFATVRDWAELTPESAVEPPTVEVAPDLSAPQPTVAISGDEVAGPALETVDLLASGQRSEQFGIIGRHAMHGRPVAVDMWGTNVISVFGVQGSGKSYTVGALLEAALMTEPALNRLPAPLGGVVFHYSSDQSYVPEFVSMRRPNAGPQADRLTAYGAAARGIEDVVVLVPQAVLDRRRREYGDVRVEPIALGPDELQLADWKLLMGIAEGNQMYAKAMSLILGELRDELTLKKLRDAIEESELGVAQKATALHRIRFAEPHIREGAHVAGLLRPGRLVVVDLRDDLIDKGEALSLFMVLLNRFTQATDTGRKFNKIIVFDEAHKYMDDPALTDAITEAVREMRHKGASIVVASQNPPSVPQEIIELSSVIVAHRFTSPAWLRHLQRVSHAFGELKGSQLTDLAPGQAYVWAAGNTRYQHPQRVEMRPRLTLHGGETRRATE